MKITIETAKVYNSKQTRMCDFFLNNDLSEVKTGFIVSYNDRRRWCKTLKLAQSQTPNDFTLN